MNDVSFQYPREREPTEDERLLGRISICRANSPERLLAMPISAVFAPYIGCRAGLWVLYGASIYTIGDVVTRTYQDLLAIPGIGTAKADSIRHVVGVMGLALRGDRRQTGTAASPRLAAAAPL